MGTGNGSTRITSVIDSPEQDNGDGAKPVHPLKGKSISEETRARMREGQKRRWELHRKAVADNAVLGADEGKIEQHADQVSRKRVGKEGVVPLFLEQFPTLEDVRRNTLILTHVELQRQAKEGGARWYYPATTHFKSDGKFNWYGDILPNLLVAAGFFDNLADAKAFAGEVGRVNKEDRYRRSGATLTAKCGEKRKTDKVELDAPEKSKEGQVGTVELAGAPEDVGTQALARVNHDFSIQKKVDEIAAARRANTLAERLREEIVRTAKGEWSELHLATMAGKTALIEVCLKAGADINMEGRGGWRPLHLAISYRHFELAEVFILYLDALVYARTKHGTTPLHLAAGMGNARLVELLLQRGAQTNVHDEYGRTALYYGVQSNNIRVVELMLAYEETNNVPVLHNFSANGLPLLPSNLAPVNAVNVCDACGWYPLHLAAQRGNLEMVKLLLEHGAKIDVQSVDGWTALHMAVLSCNAELVEFLLERGARVNAKAKSPNMPHFTISALHLAAGNLDPPAAESRLPEAKKIIELLLDSLADANARDENGNRPVDLAHKSLKPLFYPHMNNDTRGIPRQPSGNGSVGGRHGRADSVGIR